MPAGRMDMNETSRMALRMEDGIERCLRAAAATANMLNKEMERASKQKRLQEKGYEQYLGKSSQKRSKSSSVSKSSIASLEVSDTKVFGRRKKKPQEKDKKKQKRMCPDMPFWKKIVATKAAEHGRKIVVGSKKVSLPAILSGSPPSNLTGKQRSGSKKKEKSTEVNSSDDVSIPSLPSSNTKSTYRDRKRSSPLDGRMASLSLDSTSTPRQGDQLLGSFPFSLFVFEDGMRCSCLAQMEVHRRQDSDWLLLNCTLQKDGVTLLRVRCELRGTVVRNVVINDSPRPPFQAVL